MTPSAPRDSARTPAAPLASPGAGTAAFLARPLALAPLVGWGAAWPALAAYATGWTPVPPATALALLLAAVGLALLADDAALPRWRRAAGALLGGAALGTGLLALVREPPLRVHDLTELVTRWHGDAGLLRQATMSFAAAACAVFLGASLALLALGRGGATRGAHLAAGGAVLVALLGAAPPEPAGAAAPVAGADRIATMSPPVALVVLLLGSGVLLARGGLAAWDAPARGPAVLLARLLLPPLLLVPAGLVWLAELAERRRALDPGDVRTLLIGGIVALLGLALAYAAIRLHALHDAGRERERQRAERQVRREAEHAALQAEQVTRLALDRYRTNLRGILELAPAPFVVLDAIGSVVYANAAAAALFGRPAHMILGFPLEHAWPGPGAAVQRAIDDRPLAAGDTRLITDDAGGRRLELRGFPGDEGVALFVREVRD